MCSGALKVLEWMQVCNVSDWKVLANAGWTIKLNTDPREEYGGSATGYIGYEGGGGNHRMESF